jgi:hypothetical protein
MKKWFTTAAEFLPILGCSLLPLFFDLSYQINLYMIWEGAYRLYHGEIPYRDFGIPMGVCSWIIPALFFKIFGPTLFTLAKAQTFLNIVSGVAFRYILIRLGVSTQIRFLAIIIYSLTFILGLYWPQYNHTVIVFQMVAFALLLHYLTASNKKNNWITLILACLFLTITFFTKQDAGALCILIALGLIIFHCYSAKNYKPLLLATASLFLFFLVAILPFLQYDFSYWFNYGQAPHYARLSIADILQINMEESRWEKFYLALVLGIVWIQFKMKNLTHQEVLYSLLVVGILLEAMIFQVTSYVPRDNNIFFHAFACSFLLYQANKFEIFKQRSTFAILLVLIIFLWSEKYWKYVNKIIPEVFTKANNKSVVSINTYILEPEACNYYSDLSTWKKTNVKSFSRVKMPASTIGGIDRFLREVKQFSGKPLVLNMSELTPLAYEAPFNLEKGPLWFHLDVGMFEREVKFFSTRIESGYYDYVIFENIPYLNNFYPFSIREKLQTHYQLIDSFEAPRIVYPGTIEVYAQKTKDF